MFRATPCSSSGESIVSIQPLVYVTLCRWPFRVQAPHTKRSPTQSDIYQRLYWYNWFSWWWARGCSKHVENWNKYIEKNCASSWSFTKILWRSHCAGGYGFVGKTDYAMNERRYSSTAMESWWDTPHVNAKFGIKQEINFLYCPSWVILLSASSTTKSVVVYFVCHSHSTETKVPIVVWFHCQLGTLCLRMIGLHKN